MRDPETPKNNCLNFVGSQGLRISDIRAQPHEFGVSNPRYPGPVGLSLIHYSSIDRVDGARADLLDSWAIR